MSPIVRRALSLAPLLSVLALTACADLGEGYGGVDALRAPVEELVPCSRPWECDPAEACIDGFCQALPPVPEWPVPVPPEPEPDPGPEPPECESRWDCPVGEVCVDGTCVTGPDQAIPCESAADCGPDEFCDGLSCQAEDPGCASDDDCPEGEWCWDGICEPGPVGIDCIVSINCNPGEVCIGGHCIPGPIDEGP